MSESNNKTRSATNYIDINGHRIEKLRGAENYAIWKSKISLAFRMLKFTKYINGDITKPGEPPVRPDDVPEIPPENEDVAQAAQRVKYNQDIAKYIEQADEWDKNIDTVLYHLIDSLSDSIQLRVKNIEDDPKAIWEFVQEEYATLGTATILSTRTRFFNMKWDGKSDPQKFFDKIYAEAEPLRALKNNLSVDIEDIFQVTVSCLPPSYSTMLGQLFHQTDLKQSIGVTEQTTRDYQQHIKDEYNRQNDLAKSNHTNLPSQAQALATNIYQDDPNEPPRIWMGRWFGSPCRHCGKSHPSFSCWEKFPHLQPIFLAAKAAERAKRGQGGNQQSQSNQNGGRPGAINYPMNQNNNKNNNNNNQRNNNSNGNSNNNNKRPFDAVAMVQFNMEQCLATGGIMDHMRDEDGRLPWILDSGTTEHVVTDKREFHSLEMFANPSHCKTAGGFMVEILGSGTIAAILDVQGESKYIAITDVRFAPKIGANLLSQSALRRKGYNVWFASDGRGYVYADNGNVLLTTTHKFNQNVVDYAARPQSENESTSTVLATIQAFHANHQDIPPKPATPMASILHQRFGHASSKRLQKMGFKIDSIGACEPCFKAKAHRMRSKEPVPRPDNLYEQLHIDTCGPIDVPAFHTNNIYFNIWIDGHSRYMTWQGLISKDDIYEKSRYFLNLIEKRGHKILRIKSDHGGEYRGHVMEGICRQLGIKLELSSVGTPEQNGVAERGFREVVTVLKCLLFTCGLPEQFWEYAGKYAVAIINRLPRELLEWKSPYELYTGDQPNLAHFRVFGCNAYCLIKQDHQRKLDSKTRTCVFVGIESVESDNTYVVYDLERNMTFTTRDIQFDESNFSEAKRVFQAFKDISPDDPSDRDYNDDEDDLDSFFNMVTTCSDEPIITRMTPKTGDCQPKANCYRCTKH